MRIDPSMIYNKYQTGKNEKAQPTKTAGPTLASLKAGDVFKGTLTDVSQSKVAIRLSDGQVLQARLDGASGFSIGDQVAFMVKESGSEQVLLTPIVEGEGQSSANLMNILSEAGLPTTDENAEVVRTMMAEKLPIDTASLKQMVRLMNNNPQASLKELTFLVKHDIPVNETTIQQLQLFENNEQPLMRSMASLVDDLSMALQNNSQLSNETTSLTGQEQTLLTTVTGDQETISFLNDLQVLNASTSETGSGTPVSSQGTEQAVLGDMMLQGDTARLGQALVETISANSEQQPLTESQQGLLKALPSFDQMTLTDIEKLVKEDLISPEQLRNLTSQIKDSITYQSLAKGLMLSDLKTVEEGTIKAYFNSVQEKVAKVLEETVTMEKGDSIAKSAGDVRGSVEFLNSLQQDYSFLHLPMFLNDQLLQSELYVLNNSKSAKDGKKSMTALVRLDLKNLGHTDIYLKKVEKNIDVQFFMGDEDQVAVVRDQVFQLHKTLKNKGFNVLSATVQTLDQSFDMVNDFLDKNGQSKDTKRFSFDMRA